MDFGGQKDQQLLLLAGQSIYLLLEEVWRFAPPKNFVHAFLLRGVGMKVLQAALVSCCPQKSHRALLQGTGLRLEGKMQASRGSGKVKP